MHRSGHYGASLLAYSPIGFLVVAVGALELAVVGGAVALAGAMVPDWDMRIPFVRHRGTTHTVWFALAVGLVLGVGGAAIGAGTGIGAALLLGAFGFAVGVTTIVGHLLADALTPVGLRPFEPLRDEKYTLDIATAANPIANYGLLALGAVAAVVALVTGSALAELVGV